MSFSLIQQINNAQKKSAVVDVRTGDNVKVYQKIKENDKERIQVFEGVVIRTDNKNSISSRITVRRISNGVGVEKGFLLHSPLVEKVEVTRRSLVRRKYLSFLRNRSGKQAHLKVDNSFDRKAVNDIADEKIVQDEEKLKEAKKEQAEEKKIVKEKEQAILEEKQATVEARHKETK